MAYIPENYSSEELYHYGIQGMKWYVRRFQNEDGSLTPLGKKRLQKYKDKQNRYYDRRLKKGESKTFVEYQKKLLDELSYEDMNAEKKAATKEFLAEYLPILASVVGAPQSSSFYPYHDGPQYVREGVRQDRHLRKYFNENKNRKRK